METSKTIDNDTAELLLETYALADAEHGKTREPLNNNPTSSTEA